MYFKKQITDGSWILYEDKTPVALLYKNNEKIILTFGNEDFSFGNEKEMEQTIGKINTIEDKSYIRDIKGYPIRHKPTEINIMDGDIPQYNTGGNIIFYAGFYITKTKSADKWTIVFCPKQSTITKDSKGPYKTRLEAIRETKIS